MLAAGPARRCVRCWSCRRRRRRGLRLRRGSKRSTLPRDLQSFCWLPRFCRGRGERAAGDTTGGDGNDGCPGAAAAAGRSRRREARQHVEQSTTHGNQLFVFSFLFASPSLLFPFSVSTSSGFFLFHSFFIAMAGRNAVVSFLKETYGKQTVLECIKAGGFKAFFDGSLA